jgi:hypothetical protein
VPDTTEDDELDEDSSEDEVEETVDDELEETTEDELDEIIEELEDVTGGESESEPPHPLKISVVATIQLGTSFIGVIPF